ncbi:cytochrome P450 [Pelagimonas varians]|uniref:Biotin biosynthesis cytochrome P450 n=1 Tax=Pelagimonas varians TaxID=696760 RepID=A0A238K2H7_9RHOB|nr:cytochrome P450 [Pelagimonas varians]PYG27035.1 cytochrome P450 [Pelagimonas varians]SMX37108.1 Biotin biosynthesis cytochrome P450 [Pelagimonas varians]
MTSEQIIFDPRSAEFAADPYPVYAALRQLETPYYYEDVDSWMLTKMADVEAVASDRSMVRSLDDQLSEAERKAAQRKINWHEMPFHERFVQTNLLESEGAVHHRLRTVVFREFTKSMIARQREAIQSFVDGKLEALTDLGEFDFIEDFAAHVPGHIIGRLLGVPDEHCPQLRIWSENVVRFFDIGRDDTDKAIAEQATKEFYLFLMDLVAERRKNPQEDLLSQMMLHREAGRLSEDELIATAMLILMAGHGSTIDVLGSGMHALLRFPGQHQKLRADPALVGTAVQEMFRYEAPLPYFHRFATKDCEIGGRSFKAGTRFGLLYGAANRDPARFELPDMFDITRSPNRHIAFGKGAHLCLGNHLAALDMDVIFSTLNQRFAKIELAGGPPEYKRGLSVRGPKSLRIAVTPV